MKLGTRNTPDNPLDERDEDPEIDESYLVHVPRVERILEEHGTLEVPAIIVDRLSALGIPNLHGESHLGHSETLTDMTEELIEALGRESRLRRVDPSMRDILVTSAPLHDIGKTGPKMSINPNPVPFIKLYNVNFPEGTPQKMKFKTALIKAVAMGAITPDERFYIEKVLKEYGIDTDRIFLRTFYNLHSLFTYDILREGGMREEIAAAAAGHHLKRGVKPDGYSFRDLSETGRFLEPLDELAAMVRQNNGRTIRMSSRDRIAAVYKGFEELQRPISTHYCDLMRASIAHGVLNTIVEKHPHQKP